MFNRELRLNWVKKNKPTTDKVDQQDHEYEGVVAIAAHTFDSVTKKIGTIIVSYVVVDTVRQILVAKASKS